jgi:hypothetical protein
MTGDALTWFFSPGDEKTHTRVSQNGELAYYSSSDVSLFPEAPREKLLEALERSGGLLVEPRNGLLCFQIFDGGGSYRPPNCGLLLSLAGEPKPVALAPFELRVGDRLLLPVDEDSQSRLMYFYQTLDNLPPDHKWNVLHALRRPSLELRVERIEREIEDLRAAVASPKRQEPQPTLTSRANQAPEASTYNQTSSSGRETPEVNVPFGLSARTLTYVMSAVVLLAAVFSYFFGYWMGNTSPQPKTAVTGEKPKQLEGGTGSENQGQVRLSEQEKIWNEASKALITNMANLDSAIKVLYSSHKLAGLKQPLGDKNWAIALAKLELHRLNRLNAGSRDLTGPDILKDTAANLVGIKTGAISAVSYMACKAFLSPQLGPRDDAPKIPISGGCDQLDATEVTSGLAMIDAWLAAKVNK